MLCVLYYANETLPKRKTDIVFEIIKMYINRAKKRFPQIKDFEEILFKLGKLSWEALQREYKTATDQQGIVIIIPPRCMSYLCTYRPLQIQHTIW